MAEHLRQLIGLLPRDQDLPIRASAMARELFAGLPGDHRLSIAVTSLGEAYAMHPDRPELQHGAATRAFDAYVPMADQALVALVADPSHRPNLITYANHLEQLRGLLPPQAAEAARAKAAEIRQILGT